MVEVATNRFPYARYGNYSLCYQVHYVARMTICHAGIYKEFFAVQGHRRLISFAFRKFSFFISRAIGIKSCQ